MTPTKWRTLQPSRIWWPRWPNLPIPLLNSRAGRRARAAQRLGQAHETIAGARYDHQASARQSDRDHHVPMGKRVLAAVLWGLAVWTWVSMAHAFLGIPELGMLAGLATAAVIVGWGFVPRSSSTATRPGHIASRHSNRSGSHA